MKQSWSIFIFSYNEEKNISKVIEKCILFLKQNASEWELIIVDDGSTDNSLDIIKPYLDHQVKLIVHNQNQGIGKTLLDGYKNSQFENICGIPGDGEFDVNELYNYPTVDKNTIISFYRPVKPSYSSFRDLLSQTNRLINKYILGLSMKDVNWIKVYKKEDLDRIELKLTSSLIESEICVKLSFLGIHLNELPSTYHEREAGESKGSSFKVVFQALKELITFIIIIKILKNND